MSKQTKGGNRKLIVPAAASAAGAAAGWLLTQRKPKRKGLLRALPDLPEVGVGDLADDLKNRVGAVMGRGNNSGPKRKSLTRRTRKLSTRELRARTSERERRRKRRRQRTAS